MLVSRTSVRCPTLASERTIRKLTNARLECNAPSSFQRQAFDVMSDFEPIVDVGAIAQKFRWKRGINGQNDRVGG